MRKNTAANLFILFIAACLVALLIPAAHATKPKGHVIDVRQSNDMNNQTSGDIKNRNDVDLSQKQIQAISSRNIAKNAAKSEATADSLSSATTGPVSVETALNGGTTEATGGNSSTGDWVNVSEHTFYSYAQSDRPAVGCFKSADAAGGNDGKFGAFGIYWLDPNCWADKLAADELDVELNARLKCSGRKYRNAIAYDERRKDRQRVCIDRVKSSGLARIEQEREAMKAEIERHKNDKATLLDLREHDRQVCNESKDRIAEACRK